MPGSLAEVPHSFWAIAGLRGREGRALGLHSGMLGGGKCSKACVSHILNPSHPLPPQMLERVGLLISRAFLVAQMVKDLPAVQETRGPVPGLGRSPGEGNGHPLQRSCLEKPMDRGAWRATVLGVAKSRTRLR